MLLFSGFVNLYGSLLVFLHLLVVFFFFFPSGGGWDGYGFAGLVFFFRWWWMVWVESDREEERGRNIIEE